MSEPTTEPTAPEGTEQQGDPADLGDNGKKALDAERRRASAAEKQAKALQTRLDELEAANLSELDRTKKALAEYEKAAAQATSEALRWRIAARHGISDEDAETFLTGGDEESLTKQAERLVALAKAPTTPRPDPSQGARDGQGARTNADLFAAAVEGQFTR